MLCPISVLLSFCYSFYVVLNNELQTTNVWSSETLMSATTSIPDRLGWSGKNWENQEGFNEGGLSI